MAHYCILGGYDENGSEVFDVMNDTTFPARFVERCYSRANAVQVVDGLDSQPVAAN